MTEDRKGMFGLKVPCSNCPFKKGNGHAFGLPETRLDEIRGATAFQCHRTVDYEASQLDPVARQGDKPRQCAGLMAVHINSGEANSIMQVAMRFGVLDPKEIDPEGTAYESWDQVKRAHGWGLEPKDSPPSFKGTKP